jgi:hypothetical protein
MTPSESALTACGGTIECFDDAPGGDTPPQLASAIVQIAAAAPIQYPTAERARNGGIRLYLLTAEGSGRLFKAAPGDGKPTASMLSCASQWGIFPDVSTVVVGQRTESFREPPSLSLSRSCWRHAGLQAHKA